MIKCCIEYATLKILIFGNFQIVEMVKLKLVSLGSLGS